MPAQINQSRMKSLACAVAAGRPVAKWCEENGTPKRTAYDWCQRPEFKAMVREVRGRINDRTVGMLTRQQLKAARELGALLDNADPKVRMAAVRIVLIDRQSVVDHSELESRISELEARAAAVASSHNSGETMRRLQL